MEWGVLIGAALGCLAGGFFPLLSSEAIVAGAAVLLPVPGLPALVVACSAAQMLAKGVIYGLTRWTPERLPSRARKQLEKAHRFHDRRGVLTAAIFSSSLVSVPPFILVTVASGLFRVPAPLFIGAGLAGTLLRYGAVAWVASRVVAGA